MLLLIVRPAGVVKTMAWQPRSFAPALCLFVYAICFSYAYVDLDTGAGALILFGMVQLSMVLLSLLRGVRPARMELAGMLLAIVGLCWLLLPGAEAPSIKGFVLMSLAGVAWAFYTYLGHGAKNPLANTARNFLMSVPLALIVVIFAFSELSYTKSGLVLAIASGALTSGLGYAIWYLALNYISVVQAAVLQLLVPILATVAGVLFISEPLHLQLIVSGALVLGGILIAIMGRKTASN